MGYPRGRRGGEVGNGSKHGDNGQSLLFGICPPKSQQPWKVGSLPFCSILVKSRCISRVSVRIGISPTSQSHPGLHHPDHRRLPSGDDGSRLLTQRIRYEVKSPIVLLYDVAVQPGKVEPIEYVIFIDFGKVFLNIRPGGGRWFDPNTTHISFCR